MSPPEASPTARGQRLPRTCGDEPHALSPDPINPSVCPAPAGMSPTHPMRQGTYTSLPRTCGDEPGHDGLSGDGPNVCPAPAGMSPSLIYLPVSGVGLPRTCGDEPNRILAPLPPGESAPHLRG